MSDTKEITVAIVGSVDAGKSTLVGVLTRNQLDDGNGKMRAEIFNYPHERESGRTSSIGHAYIRNSDRTINFIDLCGHSTYLKTTVRGLTSQHPDIALVCVGTNITDMTKEHIRILLAMNIPFMFVVTKTDQTPPNVIKNNMDTLKKFAKDCGKKLFELKDVSHVETIGIRSLRDIISCVKISNVTGENLDILRHFLNLAPTKLHTFPPVFSIQNVYKVSGIGIVLSGYTGVQINKGDEMLLGPFLNGHYEKTKVRTIHNDYRELVDTLHPLSRGCVSIKWDSERRKDIRSGMILTHQPMPTYKKFNAEVVVFNGHHTTIRNGFNAFCNCGTIKEPVRFTNVPKNAIRSGDKTVVEMEFMNHCYFVSSETPIFIREGKLRAYARMATDPPPEQQKET
jgi:small GTP-binding protein